MSDETVHRYLEALVLDPHLRELAMSDADESMESFGLADAEKQMLKSMLSRPNGYGRDRDYSGGLGMSAHLASKPRHLDVMNLSQATDIMAADFTVRPIVVITTTTTNITITVPTPTPSPSPGPSPTPTGVPNDDALSTINDLIKSILNGPKSERLLKLERFASILETC